MAYTGAMGSIAATFFRLIVPLLTLERLQKLDQDLGGSCTRCAIIRVVTMIGRHGARYDETDRPQLGRDLRVRIKCQYTLGSRDICSPYRSGVPGGVLVCVARAARALWGEQGTVNAPEDGDMPTSAGTKSTNTLLPQRSHVWRHERGRRKPELGDLGFVWK